MTTQTLAYCGSIGAKGKNKEQPQTKTRTGPILLQRNLITQAGCERYIAVGLVPPLNPQVVTNFITMFFFLSEFMKYYEICNCSPTE